MKVVPTSCGRCFKVGPKSIVEHDHSGAACLYDDSTTLNPEKPGAIEARANLMASCVNALAGMNPEAVKEVVSVSEQLTALFETELYYSNASLRACVDATSAALAKLKGTK